jgi:hypothetical protein
LASPFTGYTRVFGGVAAGMLAVGAGLNLVADPFGIIGLLDIPALKPHRAVSNRDSVARQMLRADRRVLLLGTSRCECGIDPAHPALAGRAPVRMGLAGTGAREAALAFRFAAAHNRLEHAVVFADALMHGGDADFDLAGSPFNLSRDRLEYVLGGVFGRFDAAIRVLVRAAAGRGSAQWAPTEEAPPVLSASTRREFVHTLERSMRAFRFSDSFRPPAPLIREFAADCRRNGTRLTIVVPPLHALMVEGIHASGRGERYESWMRELVLAAAAESARPGTPEIAVWDFTGYTDAHTELPPVAADPARALRWYYEISHFRPEFGNRVLDRIFNSAPAATDADAARLTPHSIDAHRRRLRNERAEFRRRFAEVLTELGLD